MCIRDRRSAERPRWSALAYSSCLFGPGGAGARARRRRVPHVLGTGPAVACVRCGGEVPAACRAAFIGRRCPA
eukprot:4011214-Lingulodinium_polyedra.AAC.1